MLTDVLSTCKLQNKNTLSHFLKKGSPHTCNPSYSGGRDQEDHRLKPAQANNSQDPYLKNTQHKKGFKW
jgi:hypothetical protein